MTSSPKKKELSLQSPEKSRHQLVVQALTSLLIQAAQKQANKEKRDAEHK